MACFGVLWCLECLRDRDRERKRETQRETQNKKKGKRKREIERERERQRTTKKKRAEKKKRKQKEENKRSHPTLVFGVFVLFDFVLLFWFDHFYDWGVHCFLPSWSLVLFSRPHSFGSPRRQISPISPGKWPFGDIYLFCLLLLMLFLIFLSFFSSSIYYHFYFYPFFLVWFVLVLFVFPLLFMSLHLVLLILELALEHKLYIIPTVNTPAYNVYYIHYIYIYIYMVVTSVGGKLCVNNLKKSQFL